MEEQKQSGKTKFQVGDDLESLKNTISLYSNLTHVELDIQTTQSGILWQIPTFFVRSDLVLELQVEVSSDYDVSLDSLGAMIQGFSNLKTLKLHWICETLKHLNNLHFLSIHNNCKQFHDLGHLGISISQIKNLIGLNLTFNNTSLKNIDAVETCFARGQLTFVQIEIKDTKVTNFEPVIHGLKNQQTITDLLLNITNTGIKDMEHLADAIGTLYSLEKMKIIYGTHQNNLHALLKERLTHFTIQEKIFSDHRILRLQRKKEQNQQIDLDIQDNSSITSSQPVDRSMVVPQDQTIESIPIKNLLAKETKSPSEQFYDWFGILFWMGVTYGVIVLIFYIGLYQFVMKNARTAVLWFIIVYCVFVLVIGVLWAWGNSKRVGLQQVYIERQIKERQKEIEDLE